MSLQPLRRFPLDAAIIFSDILLPLEALGCRMTFNPGPKLAEPVRTRAQVEALDAAAGGRGRAVRGRGHPPAAPRARRPHAGDRLLRRAVHAGRLPGARRGQGRLRRGQDACCTASPQRSSRCSRQLTEAMIDYLRLQIAGRRAGGADLRLVGRPAGARRLRALRAALGAARSSPACSDLSVPVIYFVNGAPHCSEAATTAGSDVLGICWRTPLDEAAARVGPEVALQGNLDPHALFAEPAEVTPPGQRRARAHGRPARPHHEPRARHPARHADRERRGAGRRRATDRRAGASYASDAVNDVTRTPTIDELLARYDRPGPRYTSYPTAVEFHDRRRCAASTPAAWRGPNARDAAIRCRSTCTCRSARSAAPSAAATW